jgi:hypothetical protein
VDIVLAISVFILSAGMAYLGVHVTLHPPDTAKQRRGYKIAFGAMTLLSAILIGAQTYATRHAQAALQTQLDQIKKNPEQPPQVTVQPPVVNIAPSMPKQRAYMIFREPMLNPQIGSPINVNIQCDTISDIPAQKVWCNGRSAFVAVKNGLLDKADQDKAFAEFVEEMPPRRDEERTTIARGQFPWHTWFGPILTKELDAPLEDGSSTLMVMGMLFFKDEAGPHKSQLCRWLQPPFSKQPRVWHICSGHDGIMY